MNVLSIDCDWIKTLEQQTSLLSISIPLLDYSKCYFAYNHHMILRCFENKNPEEVNLVNIDHHHDYLYNNNVIIECSNWLYHLSKQKNFSKKINYHWIANTDSEFPSHENRKVMDLSLKDFKFTFDLVDLPKIKFDIIFICASIDFNTPYGLSAYKILENIVKCKKNKHLA